MMLDMQRMSGAISAKGSLVPEEQQILEALVVEHPEYFSLLEPDIIPIDEEGGAAPLDASGQDEALALLLLLKRQDTEPLPERLVELQKRVAARPALHARMEALARRLNELEAASDPVAHFEMLTGQKLEDPDRVRA